MILAHEGLDHAVAFDVLLHHGVERGQGVADVEEQRPRMAGQLAGEDPDERRHAGQREGEPPVDGEHHADRADEHHHAVEDVVGGPGQEVAHRVRVGGHAAHDVADAGVVEVGEVELVQLLVLVGDQTEDGVLPETLHEHLVAVAGAHADQREHDHDQAQPCQHVGVAAGDDLVHDHTGDQRDDQRHRVIDDEQQHRAEHSWQVGFAVRQDPTEVAGLLVAVRIDIHGMGTLTPVVGRQSARRRRRWTDTSAQNPVAWLRHRLVRRSPADSWIVFAWFSVSVLWCGHSAAATIHVRRVSSSPVTGSSPGRTPCSDSQTRFILEQPPPTATLYHIRVLPRHRNIFRLLGPLRMYMVFS